MGTDTFDKNVQSTIQINVGDLVLEAELTIPKNPSGLVIFAHGSSRHSARNKKIALKLNQDSTATLLVDLLSKKESNDYQMRLNIDLLSDRLRSVIKWVLSDKRTSKLPIGYFGASAGAVAAMLNTLVEGNIKALVSRGGRVDLKFEKAEEIKIPTLLIVGEKDYSVREANEEIFKKLKCKKGLAIVPDATNLFEEPGALDRVSELASEWFKENLVN